MDSSSSTADQRSTTPSAPATASQQRATTRDLNGLREILDTAFQTASDGHSNIIERLGNNIMIIAVQMCAHF